MCPGHIVRSWFTTEREPVTSPDLSTGTNPCCCPLMLRALTELRSTVLNASFKAATPPCKIQQDQVNPKASEQVLTVG